jgi:O-methyltransferase involved in polyketide biosynthesis
MTMNILDFVALGGSIASILGIFLYFYQKTNNKLLKSIGERLDEGFRRMDEGFRRMDEGFRRMDDTQKEMKDVLIRICELLRYQVRS